MVAKKAAGVAGSAAGGFFNNPGAIVATLGVTAIVALLLIFRKDISNFFGSTFGEAAVAGAGAAISSGFESAGENISNFFGNIELPSFELPSFELPSFELPSFEFPSFPDIFGEPGTETTEDPSDFTDVGMAAARGERGLSADDLDETQFPSEFSIVRELRDEPFAVENVEETQQEFQERSAAFGEAFPGTTFATSIDGEVPFEFTRQLARESEDFEDVLAREAQRSESIFAALFGNVQNPDFGA